MDGLNLICICMKLNDRCKLLIYYDFNNELDEIYF